VDVEKLEAVELVMVRPVWLIRDITTTIGIASTTAKITAEMIRSRSHLKFHHSE
jgi:hypothetical protein